jgi:hypothetical protein
MALTVLGSLVCVCLGWHLRREANRVRRGEKPKDPVSFKALSRWPSGDWGEHWKKKDDPEMVKVFGWFLVLAGTLGIIQTLWQFFRMA